MKYLFPLLLVTACGTPVEPAKVVAPIDSIREVTTDATTPRVTVAVVNDAPVCNSQVAGIVPSRAAIKVAQSIIADKALLKKHQVVYFFYSAPDTTRLIEGHMNKAGARVNKGIINSYTLLPGSLSFNRIELVAALASLATDINIYASIKGVPVDLCVSGNKAIDLEFDFR